MPNDDLLSRADAEAARYERLALSPRAPKDLRAEYREAAAQWANIASAHRARNQSKQEG